MKAKEVNVNVGITKNLGGYESLRLDYSMRVQIPEGKKPSEAIDQTRDFLFEKMKHDLVASGGGKDWLK